MYTCIQNVHIHTHTNTHKHTLSNKHTHTQTRTRTHTHMHSLSFSTLSSHTLCMNILKMCTKRHAKKILTKANIALSCTHKSP